MRVAVIVWLPGLAIATAWEARTPAENDAVVPDPVESVPVEVILTVFPAPEKLATVLLN